MIKLKTGLTKTIQMQPNEIIYFTYDQFNFTNNNLKEDDSNNLYLNL